ncbi:MAG: tetratricopeptide repeat protein [Bacteroidota bacterium]
MFKRSLRLFTLLLSIGLLASCSNLDPNVKEAKNSLRSQNPEAALEAANRALETNPNNANAYYYKAVAIGQLANQKEPADRKENYKEMRKLFGKADSIYATMEEKPAESENLDAVLTSTWSEEHNSAVKIAGSDSLRAIEGKMDDAVSHLKNATIIIPDSTLSWQVLAEIQVMNNNVPGAIDAMEVYMQKTENPPADKYQRLGLFYRNVESYEKARDLLSEGLENYPNNVKLRQDLADTYLSLQEYDKALSTVRKLIEMQPDNAQYHLVYGTTIYQSATRLTEELSDNYDQLFELEKADNDGDEEAQAKIDSLEKTNEELQAQIDEMTSEASSSLKKVVEIRPEEAIAHNTLGIIYQNKAAALFEERNRTQDNEKAAELDKEAKEQLQEARKYYEKATEIEPNNKQFWSNLFRVYTSLGMNEKAQEAMEKAGM